MPDSGRLVPKVIVLPFTPVVSSAPFGQLDVSMSDDAPPAAVVPEPLEAGLAVERLPPQADASNATTTRQTTTPAGPRRCEGRAARRSFIGERPVSSGSPRTSRAPRDSFGDPAVYGGSIRARGASRR